MSEFGQIITDIKSMSKEDDGLFVYLPKLTEFQKKEIKFHDQIHQDEIDAHQLNTVRNKYFHNYFKRWIFNLPKDSTVLEIGSGTGYDLIPIFKKGYNVIASDISKESVKSIKNTITKKYPLYDEKLIYLVADGQNLPLKENSVDASFVVASFHHFEDQILALNEMKRVTKKDGLIILAMEPSKFMMKFTKLFKNSKKLRIHDGHSEADETHDGFSKSDFKKLVDDNLSIVKIKRVWLLLGFMHYKLEAFYRILKLKKRLKVPRIFEWIILAIDEILLKIPIINKLNWHWIVVIKNN